MASRIYTTITMLLIILFTYTAVAKLIDIPLFTTEMHNQPMPLWFTSLLVYFLPLMELLIVAGLLVDRLRMVSLVVSLVLMLSFTVYTLFVLLHVFPYVPCSCGGVIKLLNWKQHLVFNLVFDALIVWALLIHHRVQYKIIHA